MKKIFFLLAFAFIGQQAFSQMYVVAVSEIFNYHPEYVNCSTPGNSSLDRIITIIDPQGNVTYQCLPYQSGSVSVGSSVETGGDNLVKINQVFNSILTQGYKLVYSSSNLIEQNDGIFFFAIP
jgi:hypothetical protein